MKDVYLYQNAPNCATVVIGSTRLFFSYDILVGFQGNSPSGFVSVRTNKYYSNTTSRHLTKLGIKDWQQVTEAELQAFAIETENLK